MADTKTSVVIKYSKPGACPPIYLAGSFPESVWQPQEMEYTNDSKNDYVFSKAVEVEEGKEYQYKFRIGNGDWWMSDEDAPIVTDEVGNRNNLLKVPVKPPQTHSISEERSQEENSTPRTLPDFDTKAATTETVIEPSQHIESEDKVSESSPHPEADTSKTDAPLDHGVEVKPEKVEETHDVSPQVAEDDHAIESRKDTLAEELDLSSVPAKELEVSTIGIDEPEHLQSKSEELKTTPIPAEGLDLSSVPAEELEVSTARIDQPEHLESHILPESEELKTSTTEVPDLQPTPATQGSSEISKELPTSNTNAPELEEVTTKDDEVLHTETSTKKDETVEQEKPVLAASENLISEQTPPASEDEVKESTSAKDVLEHQEEPAHVTTEELESKQEPHTSESETKDETILTHVKEPASIQEPLANVDDDEIKEEPVTHTEEIKPEEPHGNDESESKVENDLAVSDAKVKESPTEETESRKSQNSEIAISSPVPADESIANVSEESKEEESQSIENTPSTVVLPDESVESAAEDPSSVEQVVVEETDVAPKQEHAVSEPVADEEPIETETPTSSNEDKAQEDNSSEPVDVGETPTVETTGDETTDVPEPNNEVDSISKEIPDEEEAITPSEIDESVDSTKEIAKDEHPPSIPTEVTSAPIVTVEKVDSKPCHGEDFGENATFAQKDAHTLHAQDAVPDSITIRQQSTTPDLANVAAEVADSAALLDETPPTPPMSDEDAGKIGYRRLSHTPIPEVAETAAEVADSAAQIDDENFKPSVIELPTPKRDSLSRGLDGLERDLDIETPFEERAPLFAHESNGPPTAEERLEYESAQNRSTVAEPMFRDFDPNDPGLEPFPSNINQILEHVRRLENHSSEDQIDGEGNSRSLGPTNGNHHGRSDLATPSPQSLAHECSPSLLPIVEENTEGEPESKLTALPPSMEKEQNNENTSDDAKKDPGEQNTGTNDAETLERASSESPIPPTITTSRPSSPQPPAMKFPEGSSKLHPVLPALPLTPFVEDKSLNLSSTKLSPTLSPTEQGKDSPSITVQPATPAASVNAIIYDPISEGDAAKTTSFAEENNDDSQLRARKQPTSSAAERSLTPSSMRSAGNDAKSRNFLRAFFQVVFVDWIGGLIRRLCGGGRHTLLAVPAILIVVAAPVLYWSGLANFGFGLAA